MDKLTKGTWVLNTAKHLNDVKGNATELDYFESTFKAGKSGIFLSKLIANNQEILTYDKVKVFARESYIQPETINIYLDLLSREGKVDYIKDSFSRAKEVEIYCFSNEDAVETVSDIFDEVRENDDELSNISALEITYHLPRTKNEFIDELVAEGYREELANNIYKLQDVLGLVKINNQILYNEYTFTGNEDKMSLAISQLSHKDKEMAVEVMDLVSKKQGFLINHLPKHIKPEIVSMMEGVGLLDGIEVESPIGNAIFLTSPQLKGNGVGKFKLSDDIFHKAKILLSCLRFGQEKSTYGRGKINTEEKMMNIIKKLNRGQWLNPCTAAGQDYKLLELDGVIQTRPADRGMFEMRLRQKEVGILVEQMILYNKVNLNLNENVLLGEIQATKCITPEQRRKEIQARETERVKELKDNIFTTLRT